MSGRSSAAAWRSRAGREPPLHRQDLKGVHAGPCTARSLLERGDGTAYDYGATAEGHTMPEPWPRGAAIIRYPHTAADSAQEEAFEIGPELHELDVVGRGDAARQLD